MLRKFIRDFTLDENYIWLKGILVLIILVAGMQIDRLC